MRGWYYILILAAGVFAPLHGNSQQPGFSWGAQAGGPVYDNGNDIVADNTGNTFVTGYFSGNAQFGGSEISSFGEDDAYLAKYNSEGNLVWFRQAGGPGNDYGQGICLDANGNVFVTGRFFGTAAFGATTLTAATITSNSETYPTDDVFIAKYDSAGTLLWAQKAGGSGSDEGLSVSTDNNGNAYITGSFSGTAAFGSQTVSAPGKKGAFVARYSTAGSVVWAKAAPATEESTGTAIVALPAGGCAVTGAYRGTVTFSSSVSYASTGFTSFAFPSLDIFVACYQANGNLAWARTETGTNNDQGNSITADPAGNLYVTGYFTDTASIASTALISSGLKDFFLAKYTATGAPLWVQTAGGPELDEGLGVCLDFEGNILTTGYFSSEAAFGSTTLTSTLNPDNNTSSEDIFVARYSPAGLADWAIKAGGTGNDRAQAITADQLGATFITGSFQRTDAQFGSTAGVPNNGFDDSFVARMTTEMTPLPVSLVSFTAKKENNQALLQWQTALEENNAGFDIEAGNSSLSFTKIGSVAPKNGHNSLGANYQFTDQNIPAQGTRYYRLVQYDLNGTKTNLGVRALTFDTQSLTSLAIAPNPFAQGITATVSSANQQEALFMLTDATGRKVKEQKYQLQQGNNYLEFTDLGNLQSGVYFMVMQCPNTVLTTRIVKQ